MRVALVYNFAQHYRKNIFSLMDKEMDIDFYFGDKYLNVKKMDYSCLTHKVVELKNRKLGIIGWQKGAISVAFKPYDVVIALGEPMVLSTWLLVIFSRLLGKKVYLWTHGWYGKENIIKVVVKKAFFKLANGCLLYGNYAKSLMIEEGFKPDSLKVIHNSLDYDYQLSLRKHLSISSVYSDHFLNHNPVIVFIGRITPVKKLDQLLNAQALCKTQGLIFNVVFIGEGSERSVLSKLANDLKLTESVWFYGPSYDEKELSNLLFNADLCVAPGNIGLTAMHAMVYGCPCISHDDFKWQMPEFEAIKDGITGSFFIKDNVHSLASAIRGWLETHMEDRDIVRNACFEEIDTQWNPHWQLDQIITAINS